MFDIDWLEERMPEMVHDFPFGAPRFIQQAVGYKATVCIGQTVGKKSVWITLLAFVDFPSQIVLE